MAILALAGILVHLILRYLTGLADSPVANLPLLLVLFVGGLPLVVRLLWRGLHGGFGADHLAGVSIVASALLDEYLAGAIVVLMLSGGETLEQFAVAEATSVLRALAQPGPDARASTTRRACSRTFRSATSASATRCRCCLTRSVPWTAKSFRATAPWTSPI